MLTFFGIFQNTYLFYLFIALYDSFFYNRIINYLKEYFSKLSFTWDLSNQDLNLKSCKFCFFSLQPINQKYIVIRRLTPKISPHCTILYSLQYSVKNDDGHEVGLWMTNRFFGEKLLKCDCEKSWMFLSKTQNHYCYCNCQKTVMMYHPGLSGI